MWYLIVSIPGLCTLIYLKTTPQDACTLHCKTSTHYFIFQDALTSHQNAKHSAKPQLHVCTSCHPHHTSVAVFFHSKDISFRTVVLKYPSTKCIQLCTCKFISFNNSFKVSLYQVWLKCVKFQKMSLLSYLYL